MRTGRTDGQTGRHAGRRVSYSSLPVRLRLALGTARTRARIVVFVGVFLFANLAGMSAAFGDGEGNAGGSSVWRWMDVEDSRGNSAWGYSMSLDYGGITDVGNAVFGGVTGLCWFFYQWFVIASIWLINFALSMDWFDPLREPAADIAHSLEALLAQAGLVPVLLAITAVAAGLLIMRGAWATAVFEVVVALIVLSLGTGMFDNPVDQTVGGSATTVVDSAEDSGWLSQATGAGLELAGGLQQAGDGGGVDGFDDNDEVRDDISGQLVDTFLRTPHQLINYGKPLDGTSCEDAYDRSLMAGNPPPQPSYVTGDPTSDDGVVIHSAGVPEEGEPGWEDWTAFRDWLTGGDRGLEDSLDTRVNNEGSVDWGGDSGLNGTQSLLDEEPREIVADCDEAAGERAENPSPGMAGDAATMGFGVIFLVGLAALLAFTLIFLGVEFLWCALRSIWDFVLGLLPGRSRHTLWQTLSTAVWCLIGTAFTSIFLVTYLLILNAVAESVGGANVMGAFALVDVLMLAGLILFWRLRQRMRSAAARTAALLAKRPGKAAGAPSKMPASGGGLAGFAGGAAARGKQAAKLGVATAAGTAAASKVGATGVGRAARVGGAVSGGGVLLGVGAPLAVARKVNPWRRDKSAFLAAQGQFERADTAAATSGVNGASTNGTREDPPRPHGSREAFAESRGLNPRFRSPRQAEMQDRLRDAQAQTMEESMTSADGTGPQYDRIRTRNGDTLFVPKGSVDKVREQNRSPMSGGAAKTGDARAAFADRVRRRVTSSKAAASVATAGLAAQASAPVMSGTGQYITGVAVSGAGAAMAWAAAK